MASILTLNLNPHEEGQHERGMAISQSSCATRAFTTPASILTVRYSGPKHSIRRMGEREWRLVKTAPTVMRQRSVWSFSAPVFKRFSFQHGQVEFEGRKWVDPRLLSNGLHWPCQFVCPSLAHGLNKLISRNPLCVFYTEIRDHSLEGFGLFLHIVAAIWWSTLVIRSRIVSQESWPPREASRSSTSRKLNAKWW